MLSCQNVGLFAVIRSFSGGSVTGAISGWAAGARAGARDSCRAADLAIVLSTTPYLACARRGRRASRGLCKNDIIPLAPARAPAAKPQIEPPGTAPPGTSAAPSYGVAGPTHHEDGVAHPAETPSRCGRDRGVAHGDPVGR